MKSLNIFTRRFPFGKAESFLETEILFLSEEFDEIVIFPMQISDEKRMVPNNVKINEKLSILNSHIFNKLLLNIFSSNFWQLVSLKNISNLIFFFKYSSRVNIYIKFIKSNIEIFQNTLIYSYWFNEAVSAFSILKKKNILTSKIITRAHRFDIYENSKDTVPIWPNRKDILNSIERVFAISENGAKYLISKYGNEDKIFVSKLGILDNNHLTRRSENGKISIVSVSRIAEIKRVDKIFECINLYCKQNPKCEVTWHHFGSGPKFNILKEHIEKNKSKNLNAQLAGHVFNKDIYDFYFNYPVDFIINLSTSEGIPVSLMEAQSYGIPAIATDVGGNSEIVGSNTGILINSSFTIESVADIIAKLLEKKLDAFKIRNEWLKSFNAETNYRTFAKTLSNLGY